MSALHTRVRQWALVDGVRHVGSDLLVARLGTAPGATHHKAHVFVAVEGVDRSASEHAACALVATTIRDAFYADRSASPATSLQRAVRAAHDALCAYNRRAAPRSRMLAGATCAVLHEGTLLIAQVLPAQAFVRRGEQIQAIPAHADTSTPLPAPHPLGSPHFTMPLITRLPIAAGDALVLCCGNVRAAGEQIQDLIAQHDARGIANALHDLIAATGQRNAHALVVEWIAGAADADAAATPRRQRAVHPDGVDGAPRALAREQALPPTTTARRTSRRTSPLPSRSDRAAQRSHAAPRDDTPRTPRTPRRTVEHAAHVQPSAAQPAGGEPRPRPARQGQARVYPARRVRRPVRRVPRHWLVAALAVVLLVVAGVATQHIRQRPARAALATLATMDRSVAAAQAATTPAAAQQDLAAAERTLRSTIAPLVQTGVITNTNPVVWQSYQQVRSRYEQALTTINRVNWADQIQPVAGLPNGDGLIDRIALGAPTQAGAAPPVFILDRSHQQVLQAAQSTPVLQAGEEIAGAPVARLRDILWRGDKLVILERGAPALPAYRMLYRDNGAWAATTLARTETMAPADGDLPMVSSNGNVYAWDRDTKQVWLYADGNLAAPPVPVLGSMGGMALDNVVDLAVADGRVYLLNSNGSIVVVEHGGVVQQIPVPPLAAGLATVVRLVVTPQWQAADGTHHVGAIYVLDTQNERVLRVDKATGDLIEQIRTREPGVLNQLTDLAVDEAAQRLYLANGAHVVYTPLRPLPVVDAPGEPAK